MRSLLQLLIPLIILAGCTNSGSKIEDGFLGGVKVSAAKSSLAVSSASVPSGASITVTLTLRDDSGNLFYVPNSHPNVVFSTSGGTSAGTFSSVADQQNGVFTATFTGITAGSSTTIRAMVDGIEKTDQNPTVTVLAGNLSLSNSYVSVSEGGVTSGSSVTLTLHTVDNSGNAITSGGYTVVFSAAGGTSTGTISAITDNGNGTYTSTFQGVAAGTAVSINATISAQTVTHAAPTITVTHGAASQIVFTTQPTGGVAEGVNLPTQPVLEIRDANGNLVTTGADATADVTLSLSSGTGALGGTLTQAAVGGIAAVSGISVNTQGSGKVITATKANTFFSGGTTSKTVTSNSFTINPPAPGAFAISSAVAGASQVVLTWGASTNASSYTVKYGTSSGSFGTTFTTSATSPTTLTGLTPGTTYYFMVTAVNVTGSTIASAEVSATPLSTFTITSATITTGGTIRVAYGSSTGATSYTVKYGTSSGTYGTTFSTNATSPTDVTGLTGGTTYYFMVTAVNASGSVNASSEVSATAIDSFSMTSVTAGVGQATLAWPATNGSTSYDILYGTATNTYSTTLTGQTSSTTITGLSAGTTYYFRIRANTANGYVFSTNELSSAVLQNFTLNIPFTAGTNASYDISSSSVELNGGVARLKPADQTDDDGTASKFGAATMTGVQWDSSNNFVRLNTTTNNAELDASWTPQWSSLVGYWKLNGSGFIATNDSIAATVGSSGSASNANGLGMTYSNGQLNQGILFDGTDDKVSFASAPYLNYSPKLSVSFWAKPSSLNWTVPLIARWDDVSGARRIWAVAMEDASGNLRFDTSPDGDFYAGNKALTTTAPFIAGTWQHVVAVTDGVTNKIYVNGVLQASVTITNMNMTTSIAQPLEIGAVNYGGVTSHYGGAIDDIALWNKDLNATEVQLLFSRQSAKYSGTFASRVMDALASAQSWTSLLFRTTLPFFKELPGASGSESSTDYSSVGGSLMSNIVGVWHFNEATGTSGAESVIDSSGQANHGTPSNVTFGANGLLGSAINLLPASSSNISISDSTSLDYGTSNFSVAFWININSALSADTEYGILNKSSSDQGSAGWGIEASSWGCSTTTYNINVYNTGQSAWGNANAHSTCLNVKQWYHVVATRSGTTFSVYVNAGPPVTISHADVGISTNNNQPLIFGKHSWGPYLPAFLDEVAIWNRALTDGTGVTPNEVLELYRRGANRLKYQVRSCSASDCSDQEALSAKGWEGPDNSNQTYFSELYNTTSNVMGGTVSTGSSTMIFSNFSGTGLSVSANRYFQYRVILESDDANSLCNYGSGAMACSPELKTVSVGPNHYDTTVQTITSKASIGSSYQTLDASGFTETLGASCSSGARYALSSDGSAFYYWSGSAWSASSDYITASDGATIRSNLSSFPSSAAGTGTLQVKTFLRSNGTSACEVDNLLFTGRKY